jgi:hypothetical protein
VRALTHSAAGAALIIAMASMLLADVGFLTFVTERPGPRGGDCLSGRRGAARPVGAAAIAVAPVVALAARLLDRRELLCIAVAHAIPGARPVVPEHAQRDQTWLD